MSIRTITGGCHCGNIHYEAVIDDEKIIVCHCDDCQIISGALFRSIAVVEQDKLQLTGTLKEYVKTADSGNKRIQAFCPDCGTHLYATSTGQDAPKVFNLRSGTSQQRKELKPAIEIWCDSAVDWYNGFNNTKKIAGQP